MPQILDQPRRAKRLDRRHLGALALAAGTLVGAVACSSGGTVDTATSTTAAPATTAGTTPDTRAASAGTTPGTARDSDTTVVRPGTTTGTAKPATSTTVRSSTTTADVTTTASSGPTTSIAVAAGDKEFCDLGVSLSEKFKNMDPTKPETVLPTVKEAYAQLVAAAPAEVKAPMTTINDAIQKVTTMDELQAAETAEVKAAEDAVDTWAVAHCGKKFGSS